MFTYLSDKWRVWPYKGWTLSVLVIVIVVFVGLILSSRNRQAAPTVLEKPLPVVTVKTLGEISSEATINTTTSLKLNNAAPLVTRLGGRVTAVKASLGSRVYPGQIVVEIDGGREANPARVQVTNASISLGLFRDIKTQTRASLENAVAIAQTSFESARAGRTITVDVQNKNKELAQNAVAQAAVNREQGLQANEDLLIRAANLGITAAELAQDQATLAARLAQQQTSDAVKQAQQGLQSAQIAQQQTLATLASQKASLEAQLRSAAEQVKLMQVTSPLAGSVSRLNVHVGDFIQPGDVIGEVATQGSARISIFIPEGVRQYLYVGQEIALTIDGQVETGKVHALANTSSATTALWQVDITTLSPVQPNSSVAVSLPFQATANGTVFLPLDALNVRESGMVVLTIDAEGIVHEHLITPIHYYDHFVEGLTNVALDAKVIVRGNRTLREGDKVRVGE